MAAGFRTRRVKSEQCIGDRLKRARMRRKISVSEVEEATKIRAKFILALESDSWEQIPSEVYGRGYLEAYAEFLKLPVNEIMNDYDKMRGMYARHCQETRVDLAPRSTLKLPRFILTPKFLLMLVMTLGVVLFAGLIGSQMRAYASAPYLELTSPTPQTAGATELVASSSTVNITGKTMPGAALYVNNKLITVQANGGFQYTGAIRSGVNTFEFRALGTTGRQTTQLLSVIGK